MRNGLSDLNAETAWRNRKNIKQALFELDADNPDQDWFTTAEVQEAHRQHCNYLEPMGRRALIGHLMVVAIWSKKGNSYLWRPRV